MIPATVGVVVVTFNSAGVLPGLLTTLDEGMRGLDWTLTLVDNGSSDGTLALVERLVPWARVVETGANLGYAAGINAGLATVADADAVLILNPDVRLEPGCAAALMTKLDAPGVGIVTPLLRDGNRELHPSMRREPTVGRELVEALLGGSSLSRRFDLGVTVTRPEKYRDEQSIDWAEGSTQLISRACLDACGLWDESFFLFSEETDFGLRARDAGFATRFIPSAEAVHLKGGSAQDPSKWALLCRNKVKLFRSRNNRWLSLAYHASIILREAARLLLGRDTSKAALRVLLSPRLMWRTPAGPEWLAADFGRRTAAAPSSGLTS